MQAILSLDLAQNELKIPLTLFFDQHYPEAKGPLEESNSKQTFLYGFSH